VGQRRHLLASLPTAGTGTYCWGQAHYSAFTPISAAVTIFWLTMWFLRDCICSCHMLFHCQDKKISVVTKFLYEHQVAPLKTCAPSRENQKNAGKMVSHIGWLFSHKWSQMLVSSTILPQGQYIPRLRKLSWPAESWLKCHFGRLKKNSHAFTNILSPEHIKKKTGIAHGDFTYVLS
jgi:hypothetical protein